MCLGPPGVSSLNPATGRTQPTSFRGRKMSTASSGGNSRVAVTINKGADNNRRKCSEFNGIRKNKKNVLAAIT